MSYCLLGRWVCSDQSTLNWSGQGKSDNSLQNKALRWQDVVLTPVCVQRCVCVRVCVPNGFTVHVSMMVTETDDEG